MRNSAPGAGRSHAGLVAAAAVCAALLALPTPARADAEAMAAGEAAEARGDRAEAARRFEQAYRSYEATLGPMHLDTIGATRRLARSLRALGKPADALPFNETAAIRMAEVLGERHPDAIDSLGELGSVYGLLGRRAEQVAINEKVLALRIEVLGPTHVGTIATMNNLSLTYSALGRLNEALAMAEKAAALANEVMEENAPGRFSILSNLAHVYGLVGRLDDQLALNERVLGMRTRALGERAPGTLTSMGNLAYSYHLVGRSTESLRLNERTLALRREVLGERHQDTLFTMSNLGQVYAALGRYAESLALVERLLPLRTEVLGPRHAETLATMNDLGNLYMIRGRHGEAAALFRRAFDGYRETLGERVADTLVAMSNLARAYRGLGRHDEALALSERALQLRTEALGERHRQSMHGMQELALAYRQLGRPEALPLAEKAARLQTEVLGERHPDTLVSRVELSQSYAANGREAEAIATAEKALALQLELRGDRHPDTLNTLAVLEEQYARSDRRRDAASLSPRYVDGAEWLRSQPGLSGDDRRGIFQKYAQVYRRLSIDNGLVGDVSQGFRLAELSKARTLLDSMTAQSAGRAGVLPPAAQAELDELARQVAAYEQLIARASGDARVNLESARNVLVRRAQATEDALKARYPRYALLREPRVLEAAQLRGVVPTDAVAVSYLALTDDTVAAWVVDAAGAPRFVDLGRMPRLADAVELLRRASADPRGLQASLDEDGQRGWRLADGSYRLLEAGQAVPEGATAVTDGAEVAEYLGRSLLSPLAGALRGKAKWIVSPDGPLAQLPLELLRLDGHRVLEAVELHYAQSLSVYALARTRQGDYRSLRRTKDLLAIGDPTYDGATGVAQRRSRLRSSAPFAESQPGDAFGWAALPGTATEIQAIRRLLPRSDVYLQAEATEARLQQLNRQGTLAGYRMLHFAVHGNLSHSNPALSSLVFSQRNLAEGTDGYITAAEWTGYDLRSDLTVLSACETGLGGNLSGEGVMGLPFALFLAGNVNTVLSLWPVLDDTTPEFMRRFYAHLKSGLPAARALVQTKRETAADPRTRHPAHWAPFILVGAG